MAMRTENLPLIVALVAATASLTGVALSQFGTLNLERQKWEQAQVDSKHRAIREAALAYAREVRKAVQRTELLMLGGTATAQELLEYERDALISEGLISEHRMLIASIDLDKATRLDIVERARIRLDQCVGRPLHHLRDSKDSPRMKIPDCQGEAKEAMEILHDKILPILSGKQPLVMA